MRFFLVIFSLVTSSLAVHVGSAVKSCGLLLVRQSWDYAGESYYGALCNYEPAMGSWIVCIGENIPEFDDPRAVKIMNEMCAFAIPRPAAFSPAHVRKIAANASRHLSRGEPHTGLVRLDPSVRLTNLLALSVYESNLAASNTACLFLFAYFAGLVGLAVAAVWLGRRFRTCATASRIKGHLQSTINEKHADDCQLGLMPTRLEALITLGFVLVHFVALTWGISIDESQTYESVGKQYLKFVADRSGILSFAELTLVFLFCGRNSLLETVAGMKYTTSIVLHKWIGRVLVADAALHSGLYYARGVLSHTKDASALQEYWRYGVYALWIGGLLCVHSIGFLRRRFYEIFLVVHIVLAWLFLWTAYVHVRSFGWTSWLAGTVLLAVLEKAARLYRIWRLGGLVTAEAEVLDDLVRLRVPKPAGVRVRPGQYMFIYFFVGAVFYQSHPFTVLELNERELLVVIKAKSGATHKLLQYVQTRSRVRVCLEGPYGESAPLNEFPHRLLLSGGSGIPGPLAYALQGQPDTMLVIVARDWALIEAFAPQIAEAAKHTQLKVFYTGTQAIDATFDATLEVHYLRPDLSSLVDACVDKACAAPLAVVCCGPPKFVDQARDIVAERMAEGQCLEYFEEYQTW